MRIEKALLIDPARNAWYGMFAVAVSAFVFAYSTQFGQVSILAYYSVWLPLLVLDPRMASPRGLWWVIGFGVFACFSFFWSAAPGITARASLQLASHVACAIIAARAVGPRTLTFGMLAGCLAVALYSLAFGTYSYDPMDGAYSFVGAFASKNQLGFFGSLGVYFAAVALFVVDAGKTARLAAAAIGTLCAYVLFASQSATSIITTAASLAALLAAIGAMRLAPLRRKLFGLGAVILGILAVVTALDAGAVDVVLSLFGKDATLTGRTYLWSQGMLAADEAPLIGIGYQAYWVQGFAEAERLWDEFYIPGRMGFHFHSTYIETLVELGLVGLALLATLTVGTLAGHLRRLLHRRRDEPSLVLFGLVLMLFLRSFFEVDVTNPYAVGSFLLYFAAASLSPLERHSPASVPAFSGPSPIQR